MSKQNNTGVYQLENGFWGYRFTLMVDGKRKSQRRTKDAEGKPFRSQRAATKARDAAIHAAKYNEETSSVQIERKRIKEVYEEYCEYGRTDKAFATIKKQDALWNNHLLHDFGTKYVDNIRTAEVNDYLSELYNVKDYSFGYVEGFLKMFYLIFGQAYSRGYLSTKDYNRLCMNKNTKIKMPKKRSTDIKDIEVYSDKELSLLDDYFKDKNVRTAYMIGRYAGLRIAEVYGLTWDNINFEEGYISVERQLQSHEGVIKLVALKTANARRKVFMCDTLKDYLWELKENQREYEEIYYNQREQNEIMVLDVEKGKVSSLELVNTLPNGKIQTEHAIRHHKKYIERQHKTLFKFHNLRHTYGTKMALMNTPEHILLNQMGHSKSTTTHKYYLAMSEEGLNALMENLNRL